MLSLALVETAPRRMSSTPRGKGRVWLAYIMYFLNHFQGLEGWTLEGEAIIVLFIVSLQFLAKEDQGFAVLFGILVDSCVDGVFLNVLVRLLCDSFPFFYFCTLNK